VAVNITRISEDRPIVESDLSQTAQTRLFLSTLLRAVEGSQILTGSGPPEGVVEAAQEKRYMDTIGTAGNIYYIKRDDDIAGDKTMGWILI